MIARAGDSLQVMGILAWRAVARTLRSQWLSLGLSACIYAEAEITVLRITTAFLFSLVDLLKQSSVTNQDPEQSGEPIATIWHLGQESILLAPLVTRRRETGPCCSATVYGGGKEGCPDFPLLLLPVPLYTTKFTFPVAAGSTCSVHLILPKFTWVCQDPPLSLPDHIDPDVSCSETDVLHYTLLAEDNKQHFPRGITAQMLALCLSSAHCPKQVGTA